MVVRINDGTSIRNTPDRPAPKPYLSGGGMAGVRVGPLPSLVPATGGSGGGSGGGGSAGGGGGGGGGGSYYGGGGGTYNVGGSGLPSEEDFLAGDSTYQLQMNALKSALENYLADNTAQRGKYDVDYNQALTQLGFQPGQDDPSTPDINEAMSTGVWNWADPLTASGRAYSNQLNDFASRGMLQSSAYSGAFDDLMRTLNQQNTALGTARSSFLDDLTRQETAKKDENTQAQAAARQEAIARRAAQYGIL